MSDTRRAAAPSRDRRSPASRGAHFPFRHILGFLAFVAARRDRLDLITYADLPWGKDVDGAASYPEEHLRHRERCAVLKDQGRAQLLIQHDVDARPHRTEEVLIEELRLGVPTSVMVFNRRVDRQRLQRQGELQYTPYPLEEELYRQAEAAGFVIGHHFNAMEQSGWEPSRAAEVLAADLAALRQRFDIRFVSAHGGARSPTGLKNRDLPADHLPDLGVRWVHNGMSPRFAANYSDGGLNGGAIDPADRDLRDFVRRMRPGDRYRVLLHPQYYATPFEPAPGLEGTAWYDELLEAHRRDPGVDSWADVELAW